MQVSLNTRLLADVGKENKFLPDGTIDKLGANFWDVGFAWSNASGQPQGTGRAPLLRAQLRVFLVAHTPPC